ncbi:MAG: GNAT family N-acetyltransferase [Bacteroidales bacterium]|jgi:predicted acetyltransferase|nr:GNAT family N-acetyltransferase [Bacteroidales bacterium]
MNRERIIGIWAEYFHDSPSFIEDYLNTFLDKDSIILKMDEKENDFIYLGFIIKYFYKYYNNKIPIAYLTGLITNIKYRNKGYFSLCLKEIFSSLQRQKYIICCLIPATPLLEETYKRYGFSTCFNNEKENENKKIIHQQKTIDLYNKLGYDISSLKANKNGMIRIVDAFEVLKLYAKNNPNIEKTIRIIDNKIEQNNKTFHISDAKVEIIEKKSYENEILIGELSKEIFDNSYMDKMFDK